MDREYKIDYQQTQEDGSIKTWSSIWCENTSEDKTEEINKAYREQHKDDPNFKIIKIRKIPTGDIDWELLDQMRAVREMCELGHKVRAATKIKNRQPLRNAYIAFSDEQTHNHMVYIDCGKSAYENIIKNELNVLNLNFMTEEDSRKVFNYNIKPNFKILGPKGFGKQAQSLKATFQSMTNDGKNELYFRLKRGVIPVIDDIPLTLEDIEVEFAPKPNYMSATGKVGAIVLDTALDENLLEMGFVSEFRATVQNIRKTAGLLLTDKIFLEVFCDASKANILGKFFSKIKKDLLATDVKFFPTQEVNLDNAHKIELDGETLYINIYKEG